jgi:hypothetical protein
VRGEKAFPNKFFGRFNNCVRNLHPKIVWEQCV